MPLKKASINPFKNLQKPFQVLEAGLRKIHFISSYYFYTILIFSILYKSATQCKCNKI